jgi:DNA polymerase I-like protein with 3'-5' exonuclease and polymerase domains
MTSVGQDRNSPPVPENPQIKPKRQKLTDEEKAARAAERLAKREAAKLERAQERIRIKAEAKAAKIAEAEGGLVELPAVVLRDGTVRHVSDSDAWAVIEMYLDALCIDVEHAGYPLGHQHYELRTVQMGGEQAAIVFDASDPRQMEIASLGLSMAAKLHAHSAIADVVPCVHAGLIGWEDAWAKMHDSVIYLKLIDPRLSGSDASKLKEVAHQLLREYSVSDQAEKAKNELFKAMGCNLKTDNTTPPEKVGWHQVNPRSVVMARYAGSDVLDLAAVMRVLPPLPVDGSVLDRERLTQQMCARISLDGFKLDHGHIRALIEQHETGFTETRHAVEVLSDGKITNPKSPDTIKALKELYPEADLAVKDKKTGEYKDSAGKIVLDRLKADQENQDPVLYHLASQILNHRHCSTTLGLLLRPLENLCEYGDGRMRPTIYTINADTGRMSAVRPNSQQFSRQGGIRKCVVADQGWVMVNADFSGCEIRVAAALSGDKNLYEAEISLKCHACGSSPCDPGCGKNHTGLHWLAAHLTFGPEANKENRYKCKAVIFRKLFGGAPDSAVAEQISDVFDRQIAPEYAAWDKWLRKCYYDGSFVWRDYQKEENYAQPLSGKRQMTYQAYSGRHIYVKAPHAAGNYAIQGTARELIVDGLLEWRQGPWGHLAVAPVHDELLGWVPEEDFEAATAYLKQCMETDVLSSPGLPVHISADPELVPYTYWPDSS